VEEALLSLLRDMGLGEYEARTLYALFRLGTGDTRTIAQHAEVPRTKVYDILRNFVQKGYVIEMDTRPKRYAVTDPLRVLQLMVKEKKERVERLEKRVKNIGKIIPLLADTGEIEGNYILRFKRPETLVSMLEGETDDATVVGSTGKSRELLARLKGKHLASPFDFILTKKAVYIPLAPLGEPSRETTVVVFQDKNVIDVFRRWLDGT